MRRTTSGTVIAQPARIRIGTEPGPETVKASGIAHAESAATITRSAGGGRLGTRASRWNGSTRKPYVSRGSSASELGRTCLRPKSYTRRYQRGTRSRLQADDRRLVGGEHDPIVNRVFERNT